MVDCVWDSRFFLNTKNTLDKSDRSTTIRMASYCVLADYKCAAMEYTTAKNWSSRKDSLLDEITHYEADIICLQDCDHFDDFWQLSLAHLGYGCCYFQRNRTVDETHVDGVVIAYDISNFQLFKTVRIDFNHCCDEDHQASHSFRERCKTDDVAVLAFLQPWGDTALRSAFCVASVMLCDHRDATDIRIAQVEYLMREIEKANSDFHVPIFLGISMHEEPSSPLYHILRTGRRPLEPQAPGRCQPPRIIPTCRGSVKALWMPAPVTVADPPVLAYRIAWCPGGNQSLGFKLHQEFKSGDCIQYTNSADENGVLRTVAIEELCATVSGLSAEVPFQFRIAAINDVGVGEWSEPTAPIAIANPPRAPQLPSLVHLRSLDQVKEMNECGGMRSQDWNAQVLLIS